MVQIITSWSASLPNLIADWPVVPEYYDAHLRAERLARHAEQLWDDTPARAAQMAGFSEVWKRLATDRPSGELAAQAVLDTIAQRR